MEKEGVRHTVPTDENGRPEAGFFSSSAWAQRFQFYPSSERFWRSAEVETRIKEEAMTTQEAHNDLLQSRQGEKTHLLDIVEQLRANLRKIFIDEELEKHIVRMVSEADKKLLRSNVQAFTI